MSWDYLGEAISTNIRAFQAIARLFEQEVGVVSHNPTHRIPPATENIGKIVDLFKESGILCKDPGMEKRPQPAPAVDLWGSGALKMTSGVIEKFLFTKGIVDEDLEIEDDSEGAVHVVDEENII
ncbi:hypothetical protein BGW42_008762, partial [Actinomortierella wolfii]